MPDLRDHTIAERQTKMNDSFVEHANHQEATRAIQRFHKPVEGGLHGRGSICALIGESRPGKTYGASEILRHNEAQIGADGIKRLKHDPTPTELAKEEADQKDRERRWKRSGWRPAPASSFTRHWRQWDYTPTGKVTFEFDIFLRSSSSIRRSFKDAKIQRLENMASEIGIAMAVLSEAKREDQICQEQERKRAMDIEERRLVALRRHHVHNRRLESLERVAARFEKRDRLKTHVKFLSREKGTSLPPRTAKDKEWLENELGKAELAVTVDGVEGLFESEALFASDEEQGFDPPHCTAPHRTAAGSSNRSNTKRINGAP
ncbi:hypothetical protein [Erythrobacter sp. SD-21]|uniref:hypothetical protein n=1 Tax=Erythrobacter sp. SD-21 TaxID=161528 RepID=UPI000153F0BB|nr:hypothetical protein [Erythrobacter sp. SD-21]EDL48241.1 hypothetical protein ED21_31859 [Erythrobacter sp. SD-21]